MKVWMVRGGKSGEQEMVSLEKGLSCIGFYEVPDLSCAPTEGAVRKLVEQTYPHATKAAVSNFLGQLYAFAHRMEKGDVILMPLRSEPQIGLGRVAGPYEYRTDLGEIHHTREVEWIRPDVPRTQFKQDLLYALGPKTICQVRPDNILDRIKALLDGKPDPGGKAPEPANGPGEVIDVEELARDQIRAYVQGNFKGHELSRLVDAVLQGEGYVTHLSPPGPDGGVDILARRGALGLDGPKLCVQVKSSSSPVDVTVFRALQGTIATFKAEEGLLVSWGGFNQAVRKEARLSFFTVRLWDADDLLEAIQRNYERLPEELQNELPVKRIWALVLHE